MAKKSNTPEEFGSINRSMLFISYKKPFYDWLKHHDKDSDYTAELEGNAYLLPSFEYPQELSEYIQENFDRYFISELNDWYTLPKMWPKKRTWDLFNEWFDIEYSGMVLDSAPEYPIGQDDYSGIFKNGGMFNDDGTPMNISDDPIPAMCLVCKNYKKGDTDDHVLCALNQSNQNSGETFHCFQFHPISEN